MKKVLFSIIALVLVLGMTIPIAAATNTMTVYSDTSVLITGVYNKGVGPTNFVDLSSTPMNAVKAYEPKPYPSNYPTEPPETTDSIWDTNVDWSFQTNAPNADWIWETHLANGPSSYASTHPLYDASAAKNGRVVLFGKSFTIPGPVVSATLHIATDNAYEFWFNGGAHTRSTTAKVDNWELTDLKEAKVATSGWQSVGHYTISGLTAGPNTLYILAGNEYYWTDDGNSGDPVWYNPGAAIFQLEIVYEEIEDVSIDIKPTSCPNPLNVKSNGVLPVAILGTEDFDVTEVDPASVRLEGVAPLRWAIEDVATPYGGIPEDCYDCSTAGPDGYDDLTLKFDKQEVVAALGDVYDGECLEVVLTGNLKAEFGGTAIAGMDYVLIRKKGGPPE